MAGREGGGGGGSKQGERWSGSPTIQLLGVVGEPALEDRGGSKVKKGKGGKRKKGEVWET